MVDFLARELVPAKFEARTFYQHNPQATLMRTTPARADGDNDPDFIREVRAWYGCAAMIR